MRLKEQWNLARAKRRGNLAHQWVKELKSGPQQDARKARRNPRAPVTLETILAEIGPRGLSDLLWPSFSTAAHISDWARTIFIGNLVVGVFSAVLLVWMGEVKERYWDAERRQSDLEITGLQNQTARLRTDATVAESKIADANARAAEAQLELARFKEPRTISQTDGNRLAAALSRFASTDVAIYVLGEGPEPNHLGSQISQILTRAGWRAMTWSWVAAGAISGVIILHKSDAPPEIETTCNALVAALNSAHITTAKESWPGGWEQFTGFLNGPTSTSATSAPIRIVVGLKPQ